MFDYSIFQIQSSNYLEKRSIQARICIQKLIKKLYFIDVPTDVFVSKTNFVNIADKKFYYSISYSNNLCIVIFGHEPVGVDLEFIKPRKIKLQNIASNDEIALLEGLDSNLNLNFYKIWSVKEACMKIDQSSFRFLDYNLIEINSDNLLIKSPEHLLISKNFISKNYIYSFVIKKSYDTTKNTEFRRFFV